MILLHWPKSCLYWKLQVTLFCGTRTFIALGWVRVRITRTHTHTQTHLQNTQTHTHDHTHTHIQRQTHTHAKTNTHTHTQTYTNKYKHTHTNTHKRTHTNTQTTHNKHTHKHTHIKTRPNTMLLACWLQITLSGQNDCNNTSKTEIVLGCRLKLFLITVPVWYEILLNFIKNGKSEIIWRQLPSVRKNKTVTLKTERLFTLDHVRWNPAKTCDIQQQTVWRQVHSLLQSSPHREI
jgi:hypothetical protein